MIAPRSLEGIQREEGGRKSPVGSSGPAAVLLCGPCFLGGKAVGRKAQPAEIARRRRTALPPLNLTSAPPFYYPHPASSESSEYRVKLISKSEPEQPAASDWISNLRIN